MIEAGLDAAFFHLYGIEDRDDVDFVLGTFPVVNKNDLSQFGEERTRRLVLEWRAAEMRRRFEAKNHRLGKAVPTAGAR